MKPRFKIKQEHQHEDSLYYHINEVVIEEEDGGMVKVYDVHDGNEFWIDKNKLELN
ncbi:hypothetical protein [Siminovitchia fordii]|uniref:Uncharacterized protein n=1 Tax=Siminovitchia fordii TaxID=254759 RepID=A0ABQ4KC54_9BACI|nr:hypothetical protein [Siminovitchia fordii]GIN22611.1 hypothetical protein J1TS3_37450 [Siminovitchia fordii]